MVADSWGNTANGAQPRAGAWNGGNNQQWRLNSLGNGRYQIINRGTQHGPGRRGPHRFGFHHRLVGAQQQHQQPIDDHRGLTGAAARLRPGGLQGAQHRGDEQAAVLSYLWLVGILARSFLGAVKGVSYRLCK